MLCETPVLHWFPALLGNFAAFLVHVPTQCSSWSSQNDAPACCRAKQPHCHWSWCVDDAAMSRIKRNSKIFYQHFFYLKKKKIPFILKNSHQVVLKIRVRLEEWHYGGIPADTDDLCRYSICGFNWRHECLILEWQVQWSVISFPCRYLKLKWSEFTFSYKKLVGL